MEIHTKTLAAVVALGLVDAIVPGLPILALILVYVLLSRPPWFADLVERLYRRR